jgi:prepilin signal peptidase PulO-like enzyme (type II secretory pathway)
MSQIIKRRKRKVWWRRKGKPFLIFIATAITVVLFIGIIRGAV